MKFRVLAIGVALCAGLVACKDEQRGYFALDLDKGPTLLKFSGQVGANPKNNYVSVAPLGQQQYVFANYEDLILFKRGDASLCRLDAKDASGTPLGGKSAEGAIFNPTGVYAVAGDHLYVANYKGNNVLEGTVDASNCTFTLTGEFASADTQGPENVVIDNDSGLLLAANYDAGTIVAFDLKTREQAWVASVPQAHGVTVSKGKVFATGLTERKIYELDLKSGRVLRSKGSMGWDPMVAQYLWPTSIYPLADGNLVVSDPQSGYISVVDPVSLDVIRYTGGNGPAHNLLNYPYASVPDGDELIVLSSMRGGLFVLKQNDFGVVNKYSFAQEKWPDSAKKLPIFGQQWNNYQDMSGYTLKVAGQDYRLGFGLLDPVGEGSVFKVPDTASLFNPGSYIYFVQGYTSEKVNLLFSSSSTTLLGLSAKEGRPSILVPKVINIDSWKIDDNLVSGSAGGVPFKYLADEVSETAEAYYKYLDKRGWVDAEHLYSLLEFEMMGLDYAVFQRYLDKAFVSPAGREFKLVYDQCQEQHCGVEKLKTAAKSYYKDVIGYPYVQMDEYSLVGMVSGVAVNGASQEGVSFDDCAQGSYYYGYGVEALKTATLDDYLSAVDIQHSNVCFNTDGLGLVHGAELVWNDAATAPKALEIYGEASAGEHKAQWKLIGKYSDFKVSDRNGYAVTSLEFGNADRYTRFMLKVTDGGSQNRLIMRKLSPVMAKEKALVVNSGVPFGLFACPGIEAYPGYGIEALETGSLNDYYSAVSKEASSVCISNNVRRQVTGVTLGWYSQSEVGKRIELYAAKEADFKGEVSLGQFTVPKTYDVSGYLFSDISIKAKGIYPFYRIKLVEGEGQGRLILRSVTPLFMSDAAGGDNELRRLAASVSAELDYGAGLSALDVKKGKSLGDIEKMIGAAEDAHCGNYALVFVNRLPKGVQWRVFDLSTHDGRIHSVVEVKRKGSTLVYDPTLGVEYRCSMESMLNGKCSYSADLSYYQVNPALQIFRGAGFFYGATINRIYSSAEELMSAYF
ncbi:hypothetical protein JIQ88_15650 [Pseudomonas sp. PCH44]|uniref:hypothetical protein n=1 Tax=Pseudomonas sp. PCH44 TaxID=2800904 RepID=UPI001BB03E8C|nr:hypothetical protein [Pseudomonas sp. PCH44]MBS3186399.1 hypothetical protein [Pseudomonas sp. PCH44]